VARQNDEEADANGEHIKLERVKGRSRSKRFRGKVGQL
jgi:hypothetical protein